MLTCKNLLFILLTFFIFNSQLSAAEDLDVDTLSNFSVSKDEILKSLDTLKSQGKISDSDYQKAKKELMGMNDNQVNGIRDKAVELVKKDPKKAADIVNKVPAHK